MLGGEKQVGERSLYLLTKAIDKLDQGSFQADQADLLVMLLEIAEHLAACAGATPSGLLERIRATLRALGLSPSRPGWRAEALANLRYVRDALSASRGSSRDDELLAGHADALPIDLKSGQYADAFDLPESAAAIPDFSLEETGSPGEEHYTHAKPPEPAVPRMDGGVAEVKPVRLGAAAPAACRPGDEFTVRFVAYLPSDEAEVAELLRKLSHRSTIHFGLDQCLWKAGTPVRVSLSGKGAVIDPPAQDFVWQGERAILNFDVTVPDGTPEGVVVLKFDVSIDGITVARLRLDLEISSQAGVAETRSTQVEAARTAFASYSSQDRQRVLDRVASLQISAGMDIFLDCLSLHPGQHWESRLTDEIRRRDLFLLFWSQPAAQSKWVEWEWRRALAEGKKDDMEIHPLENGIKPPPELSDLHFADPAMAVRAASAPPP